MSHQVTMSWTKSTDDTGAAGQGYNVYRGTNPPGNEGATPINAALVVGTSYTDTNVVAGQKYDYVLTFVSNGIESIHSNEAITTVILPAAPTNLVAVAS
jgi:fibronectin type 3 domain-containing protein